MVAAEATLTADADETIAWFERDQRSGELGLRSAPLSVGAALDELLWPRRKSVVLTGATLTVDNEWNFLREQLHVPEALESQYGSPFDYTNHARIFVPTDMPPVQGSAADYEAALAHAIPALARAAGGRTLALFTAHGTMRRVADRVQPLLEASDIALEVQGRNGSPAQVIGQLQEDPRTVAFGVNALWTGVDVPGRRAVTADRLPAAVRAAQRPDSGRALRAIRQRIHPTAGALRDPADASGDRAADPHTQRSGRRRDPRRPRDNQELRTPLPRRAAAGAG